MDILEPDPSIPDVPDHTDLPPAIESCPQNSHQLSQTILLTESLLPRLQELHPDGQFYLGCPSGIYWRHRRPALHECQFIDWFYIPDVPPLLDGQVRRSYVLAREVIRPFLVIEIVAGDGSEERDTTPFRGKFWVYEQAIAAVYYAIYEVEKPAVELYVRSGPDYRLVAGNGAGRFPIKDLRIELGIWQGVYQGMELPWLRAWDSTTGELLRAPEERAEAGDQQAQAQTDIFLPDDDLTREWLKAVETYRQECDQADRRRLEDPQ